MKWRSSNTNPRIGATTIVTNTTIENITRGKTIGIITKIMEEVVRKKTNKLSQLNVTTIQRLLKKLKKSKNPLCHGWSTKKTMINKPKP